VSRPRTVLAPKPSRPLTLRQAATLFGFGDDRAAARRLFRLVRRRELELGHPIMIQARPGGCYLLTLAALRRHFSELVDEGGYYQAVLHDTVEWVEAELACVRAELRSLRQNCATECH